MSVPPPAVSGIDNTVSVELDLADSFDIERGQCVGRSENSGMSDGARVQLRGDSVGGSVWATATVHFVELPPRMYHGRPLMDDDGRYCIVTAVFAPTRPDPTSIYSLKFVGGNWLRHIVVVGRAPYGQLDRPDYGASRITIQRCPSPLDQPEKDCP